MLSLLFITLGSPTVSFLQLTTAAKAAAGAAGRKAPAGKTTKVLGGDEALTLRSKAAYNQSQRQELKKPAPKRFCSADCLQIAVSVV